MKSLSTFFLVLFLAGGIIFSMESARADESSASQTGATETELPEGIPEGSKPTPLGAARDIRYRQGTNFQKATITEYFTDSDNRFAYAALSDGTVIRSEIQDDGKPCFECFEVPDSSEVDDPRAPAPEQNDTSSGHSSGDLGLESGSSGAGNGGECPPGGS